jgi:ParB-like nuclease domain
MQSISISEIRIGARARKDMGDIASLAESIKELGLLQYIGVTKDFELIFGARRIEAFKLLGLENIPARVLDISSIILGEQAENEIRKDFTISERVAIGRKVEEKEGERRGRPSSESIVDPGPQFGVKTRDLAGKQAGFGSGKSYARASDAVDKGIPELVEALDRGDIGIRPAAEIANLPEAEQAKYSEYFTGEKTFKEVQREIRCEELPVDSLVAQIIEDEEAGVLFSSEGEAPEASLPPDHRKIKNPGPEDVTPDPDDIVEKWKREFEKTCADLLARFDGEEELWISKFRDPLNAGAIADEMQRLFDGGI